MNLNFDHSKSTFNEALGCSMEELQLLGDKWDIFMKTSVKSIVSQQNKENEGTLSLSKMVEIMFSEFTKEELAVLLARKTKDNIVNFFNNSQDILAALNGI